MAVTGRYIMVDGIKTYYEMNDGPAEKTLVCLHTSGRETRQFHGYMDLLEPKYRVVAIDMPAHGKSWPLPGNKAIETYKEYGDFFWNTIRAIGIERPAVFGCSLGGYIVYYLAQNYPVAAIISAEGLDKRARTRGPEHDFLDHPDVNPQYSHYAYNESLIGSATSKEAHDFILWGVKQECGVARKADLCMLYDGIDLTHDQDKVTCPVMIFRGQEDRSIPEQEPENIAKRLVNAKTVVIHHIPGTGHFPMQEAPELTSRFIDEFLSAYM